MGACPCAGEGKDQYDVFFTTEDNLKDLIKKEFDEVFENTDKNHDGDLDKMEVEALLKTLQAKGLVLSVKTVTQVMDQVDSNNDGKVQRQEFQEWIQSECLAKRRNLVNYLNKSPDKAWLQEISERAFKEIDQAGSGFINVKELHSYLKQVSDYLGEEPYTLDEVAKIVENADTNKDKRLSKVEFRFVMKAVVVKLFLYSGHKNHDPSLKGRSSSSVFDAGNPR